MKAKTTFRLFIAVCVLAAITWILEHNTSSTYERISKASRIIRLNSEDITSLTIKWGDSKIDCLKKGEKWGFIWPLQAPANNAEIERILSTLESLRPEEIISKAQRTERALSLDNYGLYKSRASFMIGDTKYVEEIFVGHDAPLGNFTYIKLAGKDDVIATANNITNIIPDNIENLRDRTLLSGNIERTSRLDIQRPDGGFIQLTQSDNEWTMQQPIVTKANNAKINKILSDLYALRINKFIWDAEVASDNIRKSITPRSDMESKKELYQLAPDTAAARITAWTSGNEVGMELIFGKETAENSNEIYAKRKDINSVYSISKDILDSVSLNVKDLRDKDIFSIKSREIHGICFEKDNQKMVLNKTEKEGWIIAEPTRWKADYHIINDTLQKLSELTIESFATGTETNLSLLGLAKPAWKVQLLKDTIKATPEKETSAKSTGTTDKKKKNNQLLIGTPLKDKDFVYVKFANTPAMFGNEATVFTVNKKTIDLLGSNPADPLIYRDRTMLAINPESIRRITLLKDNKEETVEKNEAGEWKYAGKDPKQVSMKAIDNILFITSNLRAIRIESHNPKNVTPYGLDSSKLMLTLGLSAEEGIQKTLILGFRSKTDGIFAMVQGQDVVFVLENKLVSNLTSELTTTPALEKTPEAKK